MKKTPKFWLVISLIICLISALGASVIQTDYGNVTVTDLKVETASGETLSALLFVPDTATSETPAPAIVTSHGWYNNREMQDLNYVEYARRGYVVLAIDMYGHGHSSNVEAGTWWNPENGANGMYDAVKLVSNLPYVNDSIGVTGHSNGALASRVAVLFDNEAEEPLIDAVLLVSNDAVYTDEDGNYVDVYGSRDAGIVACQYDEFFHRVPNDEGFYSSPTEYINQVTAQSFLHHGQDPEGLEMRESYTMYTETIDGEDAIRAVYNPPILHAWAHFSQDVVSTSVDFFEEAIGAPNPIPSDNQVWPIKTFFNGIGLIGLVMFLVSVTKVLLNTETFKTLKATKEVMPAKALTGKNKNWFIISSILGSVFSFVVYMYGSSFINKLRPVDLMPQQPPFFIGVWAALCGLFGLLLVFIGSIYTKEKVDTNLNGVKISLTNLLKTLALAIVVVFLTFGVVFLADYFFKSDYRFWVLAVRTFTPDKILIALLYLPLYLMYYVANSVIVNSYNYFEIGKKPWINTALNAFFAALPSAVMIIIMYTHFFTKGYMINELIKGFGGSIIGIWLFPIVVILPVAVVVSRKIFKESNNPYLPGLILGIFITLMTCSNTLTAL